ncbi:MAG: divalent-cation tolerance protein CutA [Candidatus Micrarchaeota archaeon]|nr:divalent-cation tolerance protein CutA [Candidatus Micrarchaeota archaeon]
MKYMIVITTAGSRKTAQAISEALVKKRLAACVQTSRIQSTYLWKGKVAREGEFLLLIKSRASNFRKIEKEIMLLHDYDIPEIIQIPISDGSSSYLRWIGASTKR